MTILFKACPRCGGDVDASYYDDVYCVQCAYRPRIAFPGPRVVAEQFGQAGGHQAMIETEHTDKAAQLSVEKVCPKCGSDHVIRLDKLRREDNSCYRCRACGHIFSPALRGTG